jgi:deoxycytidylate deaminase
MNPIDNLVYHQDSNHATELVIGLVGPIGCDRQVVCKSIEATLGRYNYATHTIKVSELIEEFGDAARKPSAAKSGFERVKRLMNAGNKLRKLDDKILAKLSASKIRALRSKSGSPERRCYIIDSIKNPSEVAELRNIYPRGFFLIAIHATEERRRRWITDYYRITSDEELADLISRDAGEGSDHGQNTSDVFNMADFFLSQNGNADKLNNSIERFIRLIFGHPFTTPTFQEYSMFMAYASSMRSADMSRQVGAVVTRGTDILASGANECPKHGGGTYWPVFDYTQSKIVDVPNGRDYMFVGDHNAKVKKRMQSALFVGMNKSAQKVLERNIKSSGLNDITEFGRVVHAEMDALLSCARLSVSCQNAVLVCTTFPCHNCAKHIIAAGVKQVIYIEPYPKSRALEMHGDSVTTNEEEWKRSEGTKKVLFGPFVGVGPRQFINLFSMSLSAGAKIKRKQSGAWTPQPWSEATAYPRIKMFPSSYLDNEATAAESAARLINQKSRK